MRGFYNSKCIRNALEMFKCYFAIDIFVFQRCGGRLFSFLWAIASRYRMGLFINTTHTCIYILDAIDGALDNLMRESEREKKMSL